MSVISGLIINDEIIISADTLLANLTNEAENKHGFSKIFQFTLGHKKYIIGAGGLGRDLVIFLKKLQKHYFPVAIDNASSFVNELKSILSS